MEIWKGGGPEKIISNFTPENWVYTTFFSVELMPIFFGEKEGTEKKKCGPNPGVQKGEGAENISSWFVFFFVSGPLQVLVNGPLLALTVLCSSSLHLKRI